MRNAGDDDDRLVGEIIAWLRTAEVGPRPVLEWFMPALERLLRADQALAFGICLESQGASLAFAFGSPRLLKSRAAFETLLREHPRDFGGFDPACPEPHQRNVVLLRRDLARGSGGATHPVMSELFPQCGLAGLDWARALVCEGPALLAWVGAFRQEQFTDREQSLFQRVLPALARRLVLERELADALVTGAALAAALAAMGRPAFVLRESGQVRLANRAGQLLLDRDGTAMVARLREAVTGRADHGLITQRLAAAGAPPHFLALLDDPPADPCRRAGDAAERWALTPRQTEVLTHLAVGKCNKTIASELGCAERTVELHVTALLERTGCQHRSELVAKLWRER